MRNKENKIRKILLQDWDPFCVGDNPNLADEYDGFIQPLIDLLDKKASNDELANHLLQVEKQLHAETSENQPMRTAEALISSY